VHRKGLRIDPRHPSGFTPIRTKNDAKEFCGAFMLLCYIHALLNSRNQGGKRPAWQGNPGTRNRFDL
jgi:hypothetical protein